MKVSTKPGKFLWLGNSAALDFVNTEIVQAGVVTDLLRSGDDLLLWLSEAGFLGVDDVPNRSGDALDRILEVVRQYRAKLRRGVEQLATHGSVPESLICVTNELLAAEAHSVRILRRSKRFELHDIWRFREPTDFCVPIAHSFATLLSAGDLSRVRRCKNPQCILFFYDTSKSSTRSWCSLNLCGNKLRVEAFRKKHKKQP